MSLNSTATFKSMGLFLEVLARHQRRGRPDPPVRPAGPQVRGRGSTPAAHVSSDLGEKLHFRKMHFRKMRFRKMHFRKMHFRKVHFRKVFRRSASMAWRWSMCRKFSAPITTLCLRRSNRMGTCERLLFFTRTLQTQRYTRIE